MNHRLPGALTEPVFAAGRAVVGSDELPMLSPDLPPGGRRRLAHRPGDASRTPDAIYLPACVHTMFGQDEPTEAPLPDQVLGLLDQMGLEVLVPDGIGGLCCGTPWKSKGLDQGHEAMGERVRDLVDGLDLPDDVPIVIDASSCTEGYRVYLQQGHEVIDVVTFLARHIESIPPVPAKVGRAILHPTCSTTQLGMNADLRALAGLLADQVDVPDGWRCCGFAGDRGMLHPELTRSATADEAYSARRSPAELYLSANRTCEIGMSRAVGVRYQHVVSALAQALPV